MSKPGDREPCQSYRPASNFCTDGFPQSAGCWGAGYLKPSVPHCMKEWFTARLYPITGEPFKEADEWAKAKGAAK